MKNPRHLWAGDWREESARARQAAEEEAARRRAYAPRGRPEDPAADHHAQAEDADHPGPRGSGRRVGRPSTLAVVALATVGLLSGAFALGTLTGGDDGAAPLPAVGNTPIKP